MLDVRAIREDPERFRAGLARRGAEADLERLISLDAEQRRLKVRAEELRAEQNRISKQMSRASADERSGLLESSRHLKADLAAVEPDVQRVADELDAVLTRLPNVPADDVPSGQSEEDNEVVRTWREPPSFGFEPRDHVALGEALGMIDIERGVRTSGSRFYYLTGAAVRLQFALMQYGLEFGDRHGLWPVWAPALV